MKNFAILILGFLLILSCNKDETQDTITAYLDAHNKHNVSKALTFYHQDIVFELKNTWTKNGVEEMKTLELWDSTLNSNLKLESLKISGDSVYCKIIENNDWFTAVGIENLVHDPVIFLVEDNKIKNTIAFPDDKTGKKIEQVIGSIFQWSQKAQDSTIYELIPNGQFTYSPEAARKWLDLIKKWKSVQ